MAVSFSHHLRGKESVVNYFDWLKRHTEQLSVTDFAILKLTMFGMGMVLGSFFPTWIQANFQWMLPVVLVGMVWLAWRFLKTPKTQRV